MVYVGLSGGRSLLDMVFAALGVLLVAAGIYAYRSKRSRVVGEALEILRGVRLKVRYVRPARPGVTYYSVGEVSRSMGVSEERAALLLLTMLNAGWLVIEGVEPEESQA